jgi:hypothetical protein
LWLIEAAAAGACRVRVKMADALTMASLHGADRVDWALGQAAIYNRFADGDVAAILAAHPPQDQHAAGEQHSLQAGTSAWKDLGR